MAEYIKRDDIENAIKSCTRINGDPLDDYDTMMLYEVKDLIDCIPAADVRENVRGTPIIRKRKRLIPTGKALKDEFGNPYIETDFREIDQYVCPHCNNTMYGAWLNFCDFCGADMRGENNV